MVDNAHYSSMLKRTIHDRVVSLASQFPVLLIAGPRQSGKTTLAKMAFPGHEYANLEKPDVRERAIGDPNGFLAGFDGGVILDEIQRAPELLSYIQVIVDAGDRPGRFILTGSQQLHMMRDVSQTLAGRAALVTLLPFSLDEICITTPGDPWNLELPPAAVSPPSFSLNEILFKGLYPRIHDKGLDPQDWLAAYYQTYVERDARELTNIGDLDTFSRFVGLCAGRSGQLLNMSSLAADAGISHTTAKSWISILQAGFVVHLLQPHYANFRKRLVKAPKLYFFDTGLLCYLLRIRSPEDLELHPLRGHVFETFVVAELYKAFANRGERPPLYFWRDQSGHEVDVVIDTGSRLVPVEIKSGRTVVADTMAGLKYFLGLGAPSATSGVLIHGGDESYSRGDVHVRPWFKPV